MYLIYTFLIVAVFVSCVLLKVILDLREELKNTKYLWRKSVSECRQICNDRIKYLEKDYDIRLSRVISDFTFSIKESEKLRLQQEGDFSDMKGDGHVTNVKLIEDKIKIIK